MKRNLLPWYGLAAILMVGFIVWLADQMSRTRRADEILIILVICFALSALAIGVGMLRRGRRGR